MNEEGSLLTVRQLQDILQVDRVTIYRMLKRGDLQGFKVGGQWRFSRPQVEAWLRGQGAGLALEPHPSAEEGPPTSPLPLSCIGPIQDIFAEALDVGAVTTTAAGAPLTRVSNSCAFCSLILASEEGRQACIASWKAAASGQFRPCHAGLLCAGEPVTVEGQRVASVVCCQFAAPSSAGREEGWHCDAARLATRLGLDEGELHAAQRSVRTLGTEELPRISRLLRQVAQTFSEIGEERKSLLDRLQRIAEISTV